MPRAAYLLLAATCIGGDAQIPPCPAGVKDDLNWYTTTSSGKVHDCAWLRIDPDTRCNNDGRFLNCPAACGKCLGVCQEGERDDDTWRRKHEAADGPHGCAWAAEEPRNRCFEMGADGRRSGDVARFDSWQAYDLEVQLAPVDFLRCEKILLGYPYRRAPQARRWSGSRKNRLKNPFFSVSTVF